MEALRKDIRLIFSLIKPSIQGDQLMKRELILQAMGWGHMPQFLIERDLRDKRLLSIAGKHFPGAQVELVAARRRDSPHGPIANRLWQYIADEAVKLIPKGIPKSG